MGTWALRVDLSTKDDPRRALCTPSLPGPAGEAAEGSWSLGFEVSLHGLVFSRVSLKGSTFFRSFCEVSTNFGGSLGVFLEFLQSFKGLGHEPGLECLSAGRYTSA